MTTPRGKRAGNKRTWRDLTPGQQKAALVAISVEMSLTATALVQLARRPDDQIRGRKSLWAIFCFVQPFGPISFLLWGIRRR